MSEGFATAGVFIPSVEASGDDAGAGSVRSTPRTHADDVRLSSILQDVQILVRRSGRRGAERIKSWTLAPVWAAWSAIEGGLNAVSREIGAVLRPVGRLGAWLSTRSTPRIHPLDMLAEGARHTVLSRRFASGALREDELSLVQHTNFLERRLHQAGSELQLEGDRPAAPMFIVSGWACRLRLTPDGRRQIVQFLIPGDGVGLHGETGDASTTICALTALETVDAGPLLRAVAAGRAPGLNAALAASRQQEADLLVSQIMRLGRMTPTERVADLVVELHGRLAAVGLATDHELPLPLTIVSIADALGLTPKAAQRALSVLRRRKVLRVRAGKASLRGSTELARLAVSRPPARAEHAAGLAAA
jgi:CRP-like cAMP-binding protein